MYGDRMTPSTPAGMTMMGRYTPGGGGTALPGGGGTAVPGGGGGRGEGGGRAGGGIGMGIGSMDRYASRHDGWTPPEMEISQSCRHFLMSRLKAAERMNEQLSEDAKNTNISRLRSVRPPGEFNADLAIEQLRAQVAGLLDADIGVIRQLLYINEQMDELRWQRKFGGDGGSPWTPSTLLSGSCAADIESGDFDPDGADPLFAGDHDPRDPNGVVRRHVINGGYGDDVTDDVFQNDDTTAAASDRPPPLSSNNACLSSEVRFKVTPSGLKVNSPDKVNRSKVEVIVNDPKNADDSRTAKVEFLVNGRKVDSGGKVIGSKTEVKVKGVDEIKDKLQTTKVEFKVDGSKVIETTKASTSQVEVRFLVNSDEGQGQSDSEGHSKGIMAATESQCQTGAAYSSRHTPHASRDVKPSSGPIRKHRFANEANRETRSEHGPQLRVMNLGEGIRMGHAGNTTPAKVKVIPFSVADDNEESESLVVHL